MFSNFSFSFFLFYILWIWEKASVVNPSLDFADAARNKQKYLKHFAAKDDKIRAMQSIQTS